MLTLALETSSLRGGVAVFEGGRCIAERVFAEGLQQGRELLAAIEAELRGLGRSVRDLDGIAVGRGPGSYTGVRVGCTAAKTLAFALRVPLVAVSSLEVLAANVGLSSSAPSEGAESSASTWVLPALDGRQDFLYFALFESLAATPSNASGGATATGAALRRRLDDSVLRAAEVRSILDPAFAPTPERGGAQGARRVVLIGEGADLFLSRVPGLETAPSTRFERGNSAWDIPSARRLGELAAAPLRVARYNEEAVHALAPAYLRVTEAERKLE